MADFSPRMRWIVGDPTCVGCGCDFEEGETPGWHEGDVCADCYEEREAAERVRKYWSADSTPFKKPRTQQTRA